MSETSDHIPAWKRAGLKVKETVPAVGLDLKRPREKVKSDENTPKKLPKRIKLPKNERPPPPEADQLTYLRSYHNDRENWKFSKQKQNWILKNLYTIPDTYHDALVSYVEGLQGGSRQRVVEDAKQVVDSWNKFMREEDETKEGEEASGDAKKEETTTNKDKPTPPDETNARIAQMLFRVLTGENVPLELVDEQPVDEQPVEVTREKNDKEDKRKRRAKQVKEKEDKNKTDMAEIREMNKQDDDKKDKAKDKNDKKEKDKKDKKDKKDRKEKTKRKHEEDEE
jgi:hypothetical protein